MDRFIQQWLIFLVSCMPAGRRELRDTRAACLVGWVLFALCSLLFALAVQDKIKSVAHYYGGKLFLSVDRVPKFKLEPCPRSTGGGGERWTPSLCDVRDLSAIQRALRGSIAPQGHRTPPGRSCRAM